MGMGLSTPLTRVVPAVALTLRLAGGKSFLLSVPIPISGWEARELRDGHRASLRRGIDPSVERRLARTLTAAQQVQSFEAVAREWHARQFPTWT